MSHRFLQESGMASSVFICVILMTFTAADVIAGSTQGNFPIKNCLKNNIDIISLLNYDSDQTWVQQHSMIHTLISQLLGHNSSQNSFQWMIAAVLDTFTAQNVTIDVRDWTLKASSINREPLLKLNIRNLVTSAIDVSTVMELKIQFVESLFKEMRGVRNKTIHAGVIFLDGANLTQEAIRNVPSIVRQRNTDVKIFVVIINNKLVQEIVQLTDTIVLPNMYLTKLDQTLLMAMCKMCRTGWALFEHKISTNDLSCYILGFKWNWRWDDAMFYCQQSQNGLLAGIETVEEKTFLREYIYKGLENNNMPNVKINIGLHRDLSNYAKRFKWVTNSGRYRPLLSHHWLPGKPSGGCMSADCGVWQFTSNWTMKRTSSFVVAKKENTVDEGWTDVNCYSEIISLILCEIILPRRFRDDNIINIAPAYQKNVNSALVKGNFLIYENNVVSVPANVANPTFLQFLKESHKDFPVFDCGEDAGVRRYISYSLVCDFMEHCSNRRDELSCLNPWEIFPKHKMYCSSGQRLQRTQQMCDNIKDCSDGSDEENCHEDSCKGVTCYDGSCLPLQWVKDGEFDCLVLTNNSNFIVSDESSHSNKHLANENCALICNQTCIDVSQLNDGAKQCTGSEGPLDETIGKLKAAETCKNTFGDVIWAPKCHYIKDRLGGIIGCRDMSHLEGCQDFLCSPSYVKCPNSYCIPQHYLLDGKADCSAGEDEQPIYIGPCTGNFACFDSKVCLHPDLVCDEHPDCPHKDDELDCHRFCPEGLRCIAGTVTMSDYNRPVTLNLSSLLTVDRRTRYLDLSGVELTGFDRLLSLTNEMFLNVKVLILSKCSIRQLYLPKFDIKNSKFPPFMIQKLDISHNMIPEIFSEDFYTYYYKHINYLNVSHNTQLKRVKNLRFSFLEIMDLSYTSLVYLEDSVFVGLPRLKHLNLSNTLISDFSRQYFLTKFTLQTLDLRGILTKDFHDVFFHGLTISQSLYTDHFQICCPQIQRVLIKSHVCIAPVDVDVISSCFNLIGLNIQRVLLWIVAVLAVLGNMAVIVYRVIWDRSIFKTGYGLFVTNLGISDFTMGVYLVIIAGADFVYRDNYILSDKIWRNSAVCKFAGVLACLSCEASTFFVFLITLDRFLVMKFPLGEKKCSRFIKIIAVLMSWMTSIMLSLIPIVFSFDIYSSNAMCLGLPLTNTHVKGWEYAVGVFIIHNFIMFLVIAYGQYAIFRAMSEKRISKTVTSMSRSRRAEDITVAKQLSLVVVSNFLFWFPVGLMGLLSLGGHEVSNEVYAWATVLLLPINSAVNPILYTIPALMTRWEKFKNRDQRTFSAFI